AIQHPASLYPRQLARVIVLLVAIDVRVRASHPADTGRQLAGEIEGEPRLGKDRLKVIGHQPGAISVDLALERLVVGAVHVVGDRARLVDNLMAVEDRPEQNLRIDPAQGRGSIAKRGIESADVPDHVRTEGEVVPSAEQPGVPGIEWLVGRSVIAEVKDPPAKAPAEPAVLLEPDLRLGIERGGKEETGDRARP